MAVERQALGISFLHRGSARRPQASPAHRPSSCSQSQGLNLSFESGIHQVHLLSGPEQVHPRTREWPQVSWDL